MDKELLAKVLSDRDAYAASSLASEILYSAAMICDHRWAVWTSERYAVWPESTEDVFCGKCGIRRDKANER